MGSEETDKLITIRAAGAAGVKLADELAEKLEEDGVPPSTWPARFPFTIKHIKKIPGVNGNDKVAKRMGQAARAAWKDMREQAIEIEKDMELHPEYYGDFEEMDIEAYSRQTAWRTLSMQIEFIAGAVIAIEHQSEETAKEYICLLLGAQALRKFMNEFGDDFADFVKEIREQIRASTYLKASARLELICLLNGNSQDAKLLKE